MHHVSQRLYVAHREPCLQRQRLACRRTHDQMSLHPVNITQDLQQTYAINCATGAADPYNESFHHHHPLYSMG